MDKLTEEYIFLFNEVTAVIEELNLIRERLIKSQHQAGDIIISL